MDIEQLRRAREIAKTDLAGRQNVILIKLGTKFTAGVDTKRPAVIVGVTKKVALIALAAADIIPRQVGGIETDVQEVGEFRALEESDAAEDTDVPDTCKAWRPAPGGVSIGNHRITAGTLGCLVTRKGVLYLLSNWHVFYGKQGKDGDAIWQPGRYDSGGPADAIALAICHAPMALMPATTPKHRCPFWRVKSKGLVFNEADAALAKPWSDDLVSPQILQVGAISNEAEEPVAGMPVKKSGRTTHLTFGQVKDVDVAVKVGYAESFAWFDHQFTVAALCQGGDSGSLVLTWHYGNKRVGLLFAGNDQGIYIATPYSTIKRLLGLD